MRSQLKPLGTKELGRMVADSEVVAAGTVTCATLSKTWQGPLETVIIDAVFRPDRVLKGDNIAGTLRIMESYQEISIGDPQGTSGARPGKGRKARGPSTDPPVGRYEEGSRLIVFLNRVEGSDQYHPFGSGSHKSYLGLFRIAPEGVTSDRHGFDETVSGHAGSEAGFISFIVSIIDG